MRRDMFFRPCVKPIFRSLELVLVPVSVPRSRCLMKGKISFSHELKSPILISCGFEWSILQQKVYISIGHDGENLL